MRVQTSLYIDVMDWKDLGRLLSDKKTLLPLLFTSLKLFQRQPNPRYWCSCKSIFCNLESSKGFLECHKSASSLYTCWRILLQMSSLNVNNWRIYYGLGTMLAVNLTLTLGCVHASDMQWQCPICLKNYSIETLVIDPFFNRITNAVSTTSS